MNNLPRYYDPFFKQRVVEYYLKNHAIVSLRFVANLFQIPGGHETLKKWLDRYDGSICSLEHRYRSGRPPILNQEQIDQNIIDVVRSYNRDSRPIHYTQLIDSVREQTNTDLSLRTVQRYGKKSGIINKKAVKFSFKEVEEDACGDIAKVRRNLQRISNKKIIFLDETHLKINEIPRTTLVAPGEKSYVTVTDSSSYAARFDMIGAVVGSQVLPPVIFSPEDRKTRKVKGINTEMLIDFIKTTLSPTINQLDPIPTHLVLDKANIHNVSKIKQAFQDAGINEVTQILILPSQASKRINPLDNALFHEWKERIRNHSLLTQTVLPTVMENEWFATTKRNIKHYYDHCGITRGEDVYKDCPSPSIHRHFS